MLRSILEPLKSGPLHDRVITGRHRALFGLGAREPVVSLLQAEARPRLSTAAVSSARSTHRARWNFTDSARALASQHGIDLIPGDLMVPLAVAASDGAEVPPQTVALP